MSDCCAVKDAEKQAAPYLVGAVNKLEEQCTDLDNRRQFLAKKVTTMEKSLPMILATLISSANCEDPPACKILQMMNELLPYPSATDKTIENLQTQTQNLNKEIDCLHEKIIEANIKLQEDGMELEKMTFDNDDLLVEINDLEKEIQRNTVPSLHSIHSEDLSCLDKIRELGEQEINLKNQLNELEQKEAFLADKIRKFLESKDCQKMCDCPNPRCSKKLPCQKETKEDLSKSCVCRKIGNSNIENRKECAGKCRRGNFRGQGWCQTRVCCAHFSHRPGPNCKRYGINKYTKRKIELLASEDNSDNENCNCDSNIDVTSRQSESKNLGTNESQIKPETLESQNQQIVEIKSEEKVEVKQEPIDVEPEQSESHWIDEEQFETQENLERFEETEIIDETKEIESDGFVTGEEEL